VLVTKVHFLREKLMPLQVRHFTAILTVGIEEQSPGLGFLCFSVSVDNTINFWQNRLHAFHREVIKIWENMSHSTHWESVINRTMMSVVSHPLYRTPTKQALNLFLVMMRFAGILCSGCVYLHLSLLSATFYRYPKTLYEILALGFSTSHAEQFVNEY
jgi:hypothetical protein